MLMDADFEPWNRDVLDEIPDIDELRKYADETIGPFLRMSTVMMLDDRETLTAKIQSEEDAEMFMEFVEDTGAVIEGLQGFVDTMTAARGRVMVALVRSGHAEP